MEGKAAPITAEDSIPAGKGTKNQSHFTSQEYIIMFCLSHILTMNKRVKGEFHWSLNEKIKREFHLSRLGGLRKV